MDIKKIPTKFIKGSQKGHDALVGFVAQHLRAAGKNILPVVLIETGFEKYQVIHNTLIWEAAKQAKLDFTWAIIISKEQAESIQIEAGNVLQVNLSSASAAEIQGVLAFAQSKNPGLAKIKPKEIALQIIEYRQRKPIRSLSFFKTLGCNVGSAKIPLLKPYLTF